MCTVCWLLGLPFSRLRLLVSCPSIACPLLALICFCCCLLVFAASCYVLLSLALGCFASPFMSLGVPFAFPFMSSVSPVRSLGAPFVFPFISFAFLRSALCFSFHFLLLFHSFPPVCPLFSLSLDFPCIPFMLLSFPFLSYCIPVGFLLDSTGFLLDSHWLPIRFLLDSYWVLLDS